MPGRHAARPPTAGALLRLGYARTLGALDARTRWLATGAVALTTLAVVVGTLSLGRGSHPVTGVPGWSAGALAALPGPSPSTGDRRFTRPPPRPPAPGVLRATAAAPRTPEPAPTTASRTPGPEPVGGLAARYVVTSTWDTGFVANVVVVNRTGRPQNWRVVVTHPAGDRVAVVTFWNAALTRSGPTMVFAGGPLAPGAAQSFGFEATKGAPGPVRPSSCAVDGAPCDVG